MRTGLFIALAAAAVLAGSAVTAQSQSVQTPGGSYRATCSEVRAYRGPNGGRVVTARCRMANGGWLRTSLRFDTCRGDIANINGRLTCKTSPAPGGGGGGGAPGGGYGSSLVLYGQPGYRGASVTLRGEAPTLSPWSFGDRAKSVQVRGRGRWEVCTLTDFRGRCEIIGDSVYDLGSLRLSNQISSARPVRR